MNTTYPTINDLVDLWLSTGIITDPGIAPFVEGSTTLTATAGAGDTSLTVTSTAGFLPGDLAVVDSGMSREFVTITAVASSTVLTVPALTLAHATTAPVAKSRVNWLSHMNAGRARFEKKTHRVFVPVVSTRTYNMPTNPTGTISLKADLVSDPEATVTVTLAGQTKVYGTDYWFKPDNNDSNCTPWSMIEFPTYGWSGVPYPPRCLSITGPWGYATSIPDDVWTAMVQCAAVISAGQVTASINKGMYEWKDGDRMERYGGSGNVSSLSQEVAGWASSYGQTATEYERVADWF